MEDLGSIENNSFVVLNSQVTQIKKSVFEIGRNLDNDLVIQDFLISRKHAEIRLKEGKYFLHDLNSTSGTYINNTKIEEGELSSGDIILFATTPVMFIENEEGLNIKATVSTDNLQAE